MRFPYEFTHVCTLFEWPDDYYDYVRRVTKRGDFVWKTRVENQYRVVLRVGDYVILYRYL